MISEEYTGESGVKYIFEYTELDDYISLDYSRARQIYAVCYLEEDPNKLMIVHNGKKDTWGLIGGSIESGESYEETLKRELIEEGNLELIDWKPLGVQKVIDTRDSSYIYQLRCVAYARKLGEFESDPDGTIDRVEIIKPSGHKKYFDWKLVGDKIFSKAEILKDQLITQR
jgi:8-oxo-dGTP pyrophosphatase MutT (NUDIX family)